jgi:hypothetical protein
VLGRMSLHVWVSITLLTALGASWFGSDGRVQKNHEQRLSFVITSLGLRSL